MSRFIALGLIGHAIMHVGAVSCGLLFAGREPWLVTGAGIDGGAVDSSAILVTSLVVSGYVMAALAESGILVPRNWRVPLIATASIGSAVMLAALFSPPAVPGLGIDALLLWAVLGRSRLSRTAMRGGEPATRQAHAEKRGSR